MPMQRSSTLLRSIAHAAALLALIVLVPSCGGKRPPATPSPSGKKVKATQRPYTVMGKRYEPIDTHVGFAQEGIASWYGKDFHGKKTSNGETYNMYALSAAHKTLPMGVFVKVKNKDTGDEIIVRVNDRGPYSRASMSSGSVRSVAPPRPGQRCELPPRTPCARRRTTSSTMRSTCSSIPTPAGSAQTRH